MIPAMARSSTYPDAPAKHCVAVFGDFGRDGEIAPLLSGLGLEIVPVSLADDPRVLLKNGKAPEAIVIECPGRPKAAALALSRVRSISGLAQVGVLLAIDREDTPSLEPISSRSFRNVDFIVWPYDLSELRARIEVLSASPVFAGNDIDVGTPRADGALREVTFGDRVVELTEREAALLGCFLAHPSRVMSRAHLRARVWGKGRASVRMVDVYVSRLRAKLGDALPLRTVRGRGYKLAIARND